VPIIKRKGRVKCARIRTSNLRSSIVAPTSRRRNWTAPRRPFGVGRRNGSSLSTGLRARGERLAGESEHLFVSLRRRRRSFCPSGRAGRPAGCGCVSPGIGDGRSSSPRMSQTALCHGNVVVENDRDRIPVQMRGQAGMKIN